jgi:hypothetical protein
VPRQNRVTPLSDFEATPARGLLMGNRGILHDDQGNIGSARWRHKNWIACALSFKDYKTAINPPGHYTQLFFCDEPTAFAAGHRPCAECRRQDYRRYIEAWQAAYGLESPPRAGEIDKLLHHARLGSDRRQVRVLRRIRDLPDGTMVAIPEKPETAWLIWKGNLHRWSHSGYTERRPIPPAEEAFALTPEPTVRVLRAGYVPVVHSTVEHH